MIWIGYVPPWSPGAGRRGDVAAAVDLTVQPWRGVGREGVGVGEAGLDLGREGDGRVLVGREVKGLAVTWRTLPASPRR